MRVGKRWMEDNRHHHHGDCCRLIVVFVFFCFEAVRQRDPGAEKENIPGIEIAYYFTRSVITTN